MKMLFWLIVLSFSLNLQAETLCLPSLDKISSPSESPKVVYSFVRPPNAHELGLNVVQEKKPAAEAGQWVIYPNSQSGELLQFKNAGDAAPIKTFALYRKEGGKEVLTGHFLVYPRTEKTIAYARLFPVLENERSVELRSQEYPNNENFKAMIRNATGDPMHVMTPIRMEPDGIRTAKVLIPPTAGGKHPGEMSLVNFHGVYNSGADKVEGYSYNLLKNVMAEIKPTDTKRILVLGGGNGYETVALKRFCSSCEILATEIDPVAKTNLEANLKLHGLEGKVDVRLADLFQGITGKFDMVVFAPPRAVGEKNLQGVNPNRWERHIENWKANPDRFDIDGKILKGLFKGLPDHLAPDGKLLLMSEKDLGDYLPPAFQTQPLHEGSWSLTEPKEGNFAIHRIRRR